MALSGLKLKINAGQNNTPTLNLGQGVSQAGVTNMPKMTQPVVQPKPAQGFIPTTYADNGPEKDLLQQFGEDENQSDESKKEMLRALQDGVNPDELIKHLQDNGYTGIKQEFPEKEGLRIPMYKPFTGEDIEGGELLSTATLKNTARFGANIAGGVYNIAAGLGNIALHPIETVKSLGDVSKGLYDIVGGKEDTPEAQQTKSAYNELITKKYGSWENFKQASMEDPTAIIGDVLTVLSGGATAVGKVSELQKVSTLSNLRKASVTGELSSTERAAQIAKASEFGKRAETLKQVSSAANKFNPYLQVPSKIVDLGIKGVEKTGEVLGKVGEQTSKLEKEVGKVIQGETSDVKPAIEALKIVDTSGVKTYKDLGSKIVEKQKNIVALQDNLLQKEGGQYGLQNTEKVIDTAVGPKKVNYVSNAVNDIKREIDTAQTFNDYNKSLFGKDKTLGEVINKLENNTASLEDINDLARYYNSEFRDKIYTKMGEAKDSTLATKYEANRTGVKDFVREQLPTNELKELDKQYSQIAETKRLVDKVTEGVNKLEQKIKERGLLEQGARLVAKGVDVATGGIVRGFMTSFLPSNIGNKINNFLDIQQNLGKHLKEIKKLVEKKDLSIMDIEKFKKSLSSNTKNNVLDNSNNIVSNKNTKGNVGPIKSIPSGNTKYGTNNNILPSVSNVSNKSNVKVKPTLQLPVGKGNTPIITPQTKDLGIIQESKIPLKNTKYGNTVSDNNNNPSVLLKKKENPLNKSLPINNKGFIAPGEMVKSAKNAIKPKVSEDKIYHTSSIDLPEKLTGDKILWTTKDKSYSSQYGKEGNRKTYEFSTKGLNILDGYSKKGIDLAEKINKSLPKNKQFTEILNKDGGVSSFFIQDKDVIKKLKDLGYDAIETSELYKGGTKSIGIINANKLNNIIKPKVIKPQVSK